MTFGRQIPKSSCHLSGLPHALVHSPAQKNKVTGRFMREISGASPDGSLDKGLDFFHKRVANLPLIDQRLSSAQLFGTLDKVLRLHICLQECPGPPGLNLSS